MTPITADNDCVELLWRRARVVRNWMNNSTEQLYSVRQSVVSFKLAVGTTQQLVVMLCSVRLGLDLD